MERFSKKDFFGEVFSKRNWEADVLSVCVEACDHAEDPLGYRAAYFTGVAVTEGKNVPDFTIGASFLAQRHENLSKGGYEAPMTQKAINLIEGKIGQALTGIKAQRV